MATTQTQRSRAPGRAKNGWITFAAMYLVIAGALNAIWAITALSKKSYFHESGLVFEHLSFWGTIGIVVAAAQLLGAFLIYRRTMIGMIFAIVISMVGILVNFTTIGAYPIWSCIAIACNALVLWAVTVHGDQDV
jgi:hypothetical protein